MDNPELNLAFRFLEETGLNVFLTGKAGTGKTTFLQNLKSRSPKRMIVVAPTGVAAINAGGVTIHSFFQLPFAPFIPGLPLQQKNNQQKSYNQFSKAKINIIRSIDLLVIDEISMVRADVLDAIDDILRRYRKNSKPFGGVQMLMIGDLQQLAPVVTDEEKELLQPFYPSYFFFDSKALKTTNYITIELKHIYRQQDPIFIDLLNSIRENKISEQNRKLLNQRYFPDFEPKQDEKYITLTTHNFQAKQLNSKKMEALDEKSYLFDAEIIDDFPEYSFPTDEKLELKKGSQVMFVKNDSSYLKRYFNGKIGVVSNIGEEYIEVICEGDEDPIEVTREEWTNTKYAIDEETKSIVEKVEGRFIQFPLKAAWAITIHKSQGLTFDKVIIDANIAFAHGQVYVALSRCRSLEGMILTSPIVSNSLVSDTTISSFYSEKEKQQPTQLDLQAASKAYYKELLLEQFDFTTFQNRFSQWIYRLEQNLKKMFPEYVIETNGFFKNFQTTLLPVSERFRKQLERLLYYSKNYLEDKQLQERIEKGATYFLEQNEKLDVFLQNPFPSVDNKETQKLLQKTFDELKEAFNIKKETLRAIVEKGFSIINYLEARAKANIEVSEKKTRKTHLDKEMSSGSRQSFSKKEVNYKDILHPKLYEQLIAWRQKKATEKQLPPYSILQQKALIGVVNTLPETTKDLLKILGIGKVIANKYGDELLAMVELYKKEVDD